MSIKYRDLPSAITFIKLTNISFDRPSKNLSVYRFVNSMMEHVRFLENERDKLLQNCCNPIHDTPGAYTITDIYKEKMQEILEMEIVPVTPIQIPDLTEDDFSDSKCQYPTDKQMWMNGQEISAVLYLLKKFNDKKN